MPPTAVQRPPDAASRAVKPACGCQAPSDRAAFVGWVSRLVREHRGYLLGVVRREGLGAEDAFDAVQETFQAFLTLPAARSLVDAPDDSRKLLTVLARNVARNRRRLHAVARPHDGGAALLASLSDGAASVEDLLAAAEDQVRLRGCVYTLGDVQRAVVTLRMLEEESGEDVAQRLGITPGHVAVLLHRAKASLLACMTAPEAGEHAAATAPVDS